MFRKIGSKKNRGQTALEYALVIGVIAVGIIFVGKRLFSDPDKGAGAIMNQAIESAKNTF